MKNKSHNQFCPLCTQENLCAVDDAKSCWCMNKNVPESLIASLPTSEQGKRCICESCINKYKLANKARL